MSTEFRATPESPDVPLPVHARPLHRLFKTTGIGWASFASPLIGGGVLLYMNSRRMGMRASGRRHLLCSCVATLLWVVISTVVIGKMRFGLISPALIAWTVGAAVVAGATVYVRRTQRENIRRHRAAGGEFESNWVAFAIGLLITSAELLLTLIALFIAISVIK